MVARGPRSRLHVTILACDAVTARGAGPPLVIHGHQQIPRERTTQLMAFGAELRLPEIIEARRVLPPVGFFDGCIGDDAAMTDLAAYAFVTVLAPVAGEARRVSDDSVE